MTLLAADVVRIVTGDDTPTWVVAGATVALFVATGLLFWATKRMVETAGSQVDIESNRIAAAQRPHVYAVTLDPGVAQEVPYHNGRAREVIPLANAGPGIAHNVTGLLRFADGVFVPLVPLTIQPAQTLDARFDWGGYPARRGGRTPTASSSTTMLRAKPGAPETWCTEYYVRESNERLFFEFEQSGRLAEFGDLFRRFGIALGAVRGAINRTLDQALRLSRQ